MNLICKIFGHKPYKYDGEMSPHMSPEDNVSHFGCSLNVTSLSFKTTCNRCFNDYVVGHASAASIRVRINKHYALSEIKPITKPEENKFPPILPELLQNV